MVAACLGEAAVLFLVTEEEAGGVYSQEVLAFLNDIGRLKRGVMPALLIDAHPIPILHHRVIRQHHPENDVNGAHD